MALTDVAIRTLKPTPKHQFIADKDGLYLRVHPSGTKTFVFRSRVNGTARWTTLGTFPAMGLKEARKMTAALTGTSGPSTVTLEQAFEQWYVRVQATYKSPAQVKQRFLAYMQPAFGNRTVASITRKEVSAELSLVAARGPVAANRALADAKLLFAYCVERGWIESSPIEKLTFKAVGGREVPRDRVLTEDEIRQLIAALRSGNMRKDAAYALGIALLTGQRSGEVRQIEKAQIFNNFWTVPPQATKNGTASKVSCKYFLHRTTSQAFRELGDKPFDGMEAQVLSRAMATLNFSPRATPHDLRRTMATKMADLGVMPHVVEKCLNHKMKGVMAVYNRAEYLPEKAAAWRLWQKYLLKLAKKRPPSGGLNSAGGAEGDMNPTNQETRK